MAPITWALIHFGPAGILLGALFRMPYSYYEMLRIFVCAAAVFMAVTDWGKSGRVTLWTSLFLTIAIVFNPIVPIHLNRAVWAFLNIAAAGPFIAHWWFTQRPLMRHEIANK